MRHNSTLRVEGSISPNWPSTQHAMAIKSGGNVSTRGDKESDKGTGCHAMLCHETQLPKGSYTLLLYCLTACSSSAVCCLHVQSAYSLTHIP